MHEKRHLTAEEVRRLPLGLYADRAIPITKREGAIHYYTEVE